ncbi:M15 family metallopeptidase [Protaetiibacter larvae]|uniref:M15 family metallopeptidase n=1 Tax=Protaetiibacter larvae TaxID=2592654 RepID=A0A5C1Y6U0_9MICO|nr:M15 family metallopeptidase [Protaetiibacter larvae]QEO08945.1 M15 family metallopeptidase [Protaetiibacter larvae]
MTAPSPATRSASERKARARQLRRRRIAVLGTLVAVLVVALVVTIAVALAPSGSPEAGPRDPASESPSASAGTPTPEPTVETPPPPPAFDKTQYSLTDPDSPWVIVNKLNPMNPVDFQPAVVPVPVPYINPAYLRQEPADAVVRMFADFQAQTGLQMQVLSSYRSYAAQQQVYGGNDLLTARPGFSEHQTGWVLDVDALPRACSLQLCFRDTPQGQWLAQHAWEYGFIIRYADGYTGITGYQYEPWHLRYVGPALAKEMHDTGVVTLEEFFGYPAAPDYP